MMTKAEQISIHEGYCLTFQTQIARFKPIVEGKDREASRNAAGAMCDAEMNLHKHQHALKELRG